MNKKKLLLGIITVIFTLAACDSNSTPWYSDWGLGKKLTAEHSNNVKYNWYIDQKNTGRYSDENCGPTCATMVIKWSNQSFSKTTEDARNKYLAGGGWWYTDNITDYLSDNNTENYIASLNEPIQLINQLKMGNIAILCLDMYYVRYEEKREWHIDKFYNTKSEGWGHFIVVKGYKIVDEIVWLEVYDPNSWNVRYGDGSLKGCDRYYRSEDIMKATNVWWKYMIVIKNSKARAIRTGEIDPSTIVHQWGR